jgi:hypothetical protein
MRYYYYYYYCIVDCSRGKIFGDIGDLLLFPTNLIPYARDWKITSVFADLSRQQHADELHVLASLEVVVEALCYYMLASYCVVRGTRSKTSGGVPWFITELHCRKSLDVTKTASVQLG